MATPLYKRYIPPKPSGTAARAPQPVLKAIRNSKPDEEPTKRKRERTEEEIAERKAKKLRKKGIDPDTVVAETTSDSRQEANVPKKRKAHHLDWEALDQIFENAEESTQVKSPRRQRAAQRGNASQPAPDGSELANEQQAAGEFAHIKSTKKRHKLEKEARKARKAAANGVNGQAVSKGRVEDESIAENEDRSVGIQDALDGPDPIQKALPNDSAALKSLGQAQDESSSKTDAAVSKAKKQQKDKTKRKEITNTDDPESMTLSKSSRDGDDQSISQPKKRRHKLEHVFEEPKDQIDIQTNHDREHLQKHKGILKKLDRAAELSQGAPQGTAVATEQSNTSQPVVLDLAPLPQPEQPEPTEFKLDPASLPAWLAEPHVISSDSKKTFANMGLDSKIVQRMSGLGFDDALPIQQALIPVLMPPGNPGARFLPGCESVLPDVTVGAPTGSGKTIGYLLPVIESLKKTSDSGHLKALVVVPTRELVMQVAAVAESFAKSSSIKIGMATGAGNFRDEQAKLIRSRRRYDPEAYQELIAKAHRRNYPPTEDSEEFDEYLKDLENEDGRQEKRISDAVACLVNHVPTYESAVDILVATPGRLLEHLNGTLGFNLAHVEWLVLDEADKLLDQVYDGFLETINQELMRPRALEQQDAREQYLRAQKAWSEQTERRVRKVVLSATMTKDVSKLVGLKLSRPQMVIVRSQDQNTATRTSGNGAADVDMTAGAKDSESVFELPPTLSEYSVHVGDGTEKPLFLVELLRTRIISKPNRNGMVSRKLDTESSDGTSVDDNSDTSSSSDSDSDPDSDSSSASSSESSEQESDNEAVSNAPKTTLSQAMDQDDGDGVAIHPDRAAMLNRLSLRERGPALVPTILIFTSSTESANRLSHLLCNVQPEWASWISTMTRSDGKNKLRINSKPEDPAIIISTDRAGRGLDAISNRTITHVVQYDVPRSVKDYVHRVGRTARAGRHGEAWTLFTHSQARWFINSIVKAKNIKRAESVEKVKMVVEDDELQERLQKVVAEVRDEVFGGGHRKH